MRLACTGREFRTTTDTYHMARVCEHLVLNDGYRGLLVLDSQLRLVRSIHLLDGLIIHSSFVHEVNPEVALYCPDNDRLVRVSVETGAVASVPLSGLPSYSALTDYYAWRDDHLVVYACDAGFYEISFDPPQVGFVSLEMLQSTHPELVRLWHEAQAAGAAQVWSRELRYAVLNEAEGIVRVRDLAAEETFEVGAAVGGVHEIAFDCGMLALVHEAGLTIHSHSSVRACLHPPDGEYFLRAHFIACEPSTLALLAGWKADPTRGVLATYHVSP